MKLIKLNLAVTSFCSTILLLVLMWNEDKATCGLVTCKLFETMFAIVGLFTAVECAKINLSDTAHRQVE